MSSIWYSRSLKAWALTPVSLLFYFLSSIRRALYKRGVLQVNTFNVPVIVVGNISVGGTGKTPIVSALVARLQSQGLKPGIVSRGYGAQKSREPRKVDKQTPVDLAGDEPALLARDTSVPIYISANRSEAVYALINNSDVNVVISDDGMQHYAMGRDIEIAVVDGQRGFGNGFVLPAGPLRERPKRLSDVDLIAVQQANHNSSQSCDVRAEALNIDGGTRAGHFWLQISQLKNIHNDQVFELASFKGKHVHAVAGLGNPQRYFDSLKRNGLEIVEHAMPDHHKYEVSDLSFDLDYPILVTSKDAVKIRQLDMDKQNIYEVSVEAVFDANLEDALDTLVASLL